MSDRSPLASKHIAVTRARHQAAELEELIRELGGVPIPFPCIAIEPAEPNALDHYLA